MDEYKEIFTSDLSEVEKVAQAFDLVTSRVVDHSLKEIELFKAMGDKESLIKEHIKIETIKFARGLFNEAFKNAIGRSAWDE